MERSSESTVDRANMLNPNRNMRERLRSETMAKSLTDHMLFTLTVALTATRKILA